MDLNNENSANFWKQKGQEAVRERLERKINESEYRYWVDVLNGKFFFLDFQLYVNFDINIH